MLLSCQGTHNPASDWNLFNRFPIIQKLASGQYESLLKDKLKRKGWISETVIIIQQWLLHHCHQVETSLQSHSLSKLGENWEILCAQVWSIPAYAKLSFWHRQASEMKHWTYYRNQNECSPCSYIEATVENEFTFDKLGYGNCQMRWQKISSWELYVCDNQNVSFFALIYIFIQVVCKEGGPHNTAVQRHGSISGRARLLFQHIKPIQDQSLWYQGVKPI